VGVNPVNQDPIYGRQKTFLIRKKFKILIFTSQRGMYTYSFSYQKVSKGLRRTQEKEKKSLYCGSMFINVDPDPDSGSPINPDPNTVLGP
jgi:hypothetical protein